MTLVNLAQINNGDEADDSLFNARFGALANVINGGIDAENLADNAVSTSKLAAQSVTSAKMNFTKTVDANGWTVFDYGTFKVYKKRGTVTHAIGSGGWGFLPANLRLNLPTGITSITTAHFIESSVGTTDSAIAVAFYAPVGATYLDISMLNHYTGGTVTTTMPYSISITV